MPARPARPTPARPSAKKPSKALGCITLLIIALMGGCALNAIAGDGPAPQEVESTDTPEPSPVRTPQLDPNPSPADVVPAPAAPAPVVTPAAPLTDTPDGLDPALPPAYLEGPAAPQSFVWDTCKEAELKGSGAVYRTVPDSGYGPHLDDDLDGVGCEDLG